MTELFLDKLKEKLYRLTHLSIKRQIVGDLVIYSLNDDEKTKYEDIDQLIQDLHKSFNSEQQHVFFKWDDRTKPIDPQFPRRLNPGIGTIFYTMGNAGPPHLVTWSALLKNIDISEADNIYRHFLIEYTMPELISLSKSNLDLMKVLINTFMNPDNKLHMMKQRDKYDIKYTFEYLQDVNLGNDVADALYSYVYKNKEHIFSIGDPEYYHELHDSIIQFVRNNFDKEYWTDFTNLLNNNFVKTHYDIISDNETKIKKFNISVPGIYQQYSPIMMLDDIDRALSVFNLVVNKKLFELEHCSYAIDSPSTIIMTVESREEASFSLFKRVLHDILLQYSAKMLDYPQEKYGNGPHTKLNFQFEKHMNELIDSLALKYELEDALPASEIKTPRKKI